MKRKAGRQNIQVALFPFLAVLICTLGSLIVLLVLFTAQAKVEARSHVAAQAPGPDPEEARQAQEAYDDARWRRELLESQRTEKQTELANARDKLSYLEDHLRTLETRARELIARAEAIDSGDELKADELAAARQELARLDAQIKDKKRELDEARQKQAAAEQWFALIPYDGPNGTRRRPIYIECTAEGIILQPEGIVFRPDDFNGPMGPGNPLDRALRTVREHVRATGSQSGECYPLLVVRPSGVVAYGAARSALRGWDDEFGYELIDDNKRLDYGEPDPNLAQQLKRSVAEARQHQAALIAKMPRKFEGEEPLTTFDPAAVPGLNAQAFGSSGIGTPGGAGSGFGGGTGSGPGGSSGSGSFGSTGGPELGAPTGESSPAASGNFPGFTGGPASGGSLPPSQWSAAGGAGSPGPYGSSGSPGSESGAAGGSGQSAGGSPGGTSGGLGATRPGGVAGGPSLGTSAGSPGSTSGDAPSGSGSSRRGASGSNSASSNSASQGSASSGSAVASGRGRGSNWGLSGATARSTGITRPLQVVVLLDRLVLVPERGDSRPAQQLKVSPQMSQAELDKFVETVQLEMKSWGLAVEGGYWKPILQIEVAPDAERHYADLVRGLEGSGFELERKRP